MCNSSFDLSSVFVHLDCTYLKVPAAMVCIIFLVFEGILFGLFTLAMFCTQVCSICKDETVTILRAWLNYQETVDQLVELLPTFLQSSVLFTLYCF